MLVKYLCIMCLGFGAVCLNQAFAAVPAADVTAEQIAAAMPKELSHPYLYFTEADKPAIRERIANDPVCARIYADLKAKADSYLNAKSVRRPDVTALAFVYQMTGDKRYAQRAFEFMPKEYPPVNGGFDLNASRACRGLAPIYDWLYTGLTEEQRAHLRTGLLRQINLVRGKYDNTWWVTAYRCNWNGVCNSGAGVAAIAMLADDPTMVDVLAQSYNGIYRLYDELGRDGDWTEGVNYWSYGVFVSMLFGDSLNKLTDGKFNLFEHEKIVANPVTFGIHTLIPVGPHVAKPYDARGREWKSVNYEDSGSKREDSTFNYNKMAEATGSGEAIWLRDTIFGADAGDSVFDIIWPKPAIKPVTPAVASKHFRDYGWVVMRSDFESVDKVIVSAVAAEHRDPTREIYIARFKGADLIPASEKPWGIELKHDMYFFSHGHLHAGTFNVYWQGEAYICDLGAPAYPKDFWTPQRWDHIFANSLGHNTVIVNGEQQISGLGIGGKILEFRTGNSRDYTLMDMTAAYPGKELKKWQRHLILDKPTATVVLDEIGAKKGDDISIRFHSDCKAEPKGRVLMLKGQSGLMALIPVMQGQWKFASGEHNLNPKYPNWDDWHAPFDNIMRAYTDVKLTAQQEITFAATIIVPVDDLRQAQMIAASVKLELLPQGGASIVFEKDGQKSVFEFSNEKDGLRLK